MNNSELSLTLLVLEVDHFDLFFFLPDLLFSVFEDVLLNVGFFVQNTKFVVAVDELNTHVVSILAGLLIGVDQVVHFFLERVDDQVQFVGLVDLLADDGLFLVELEVKLVQVRSP